MTASDLSPHLLPLQGDLWEVDLEPVQGNEIQESRPCVVISNDAMNTRLGLSIVVPVTGTPRYLSSGKLTPTMVELTVSENELMKTSYTVAYQVRTVSHSRFKRRFGRLTPRLILQVVQSVQRLIDY